MRVYDLWLPIALSGLATHILSTIAWTASPHHKPDWVQLPAEDELYDFLGKRQPPPGQYIFPYAGSGQETKTDAFQAKQKKYTGMLILWAAPNHMGKAIGKTLAAFMVIAFVIGYLASIGLSRGAEFVRVMQFVTTAGLLAHVSANFPYIFWFRRRIAMEILDGTLFAIATGLIFAFLWPK